MDEPAPNARLPDLLDAAREGDARATDELLPLLYDELRKLARARMARERPGDSLRPTGLVHEAYLRLLGPEGAATWRNRGHFFAAAAEAMRRVLIERARGRSRAKRGSDPRRTTLDEGAFAVEVAPERLLDVDRALERLESQDAEMAAVVKLRYFAGLTVDECASALALSPRSVNRHWTSARAWLRAELGPDPDGTGGPAGEPRKAQGTTGNLARHAAVSRGRPQRS
jgi:RNA polymerase sigma factor (TIGR02999 family)